MIERKRGGTRTEKWPTERVRAEVDKYLPAGLWDLLAAIVKDANPTMSDAQAMDRLETLADAVDWTPWA